MVAQWNVKVSVTLFNYERERLHYVLRAFTREEAKEEAVRQALMLTARHRPISATVDHIACNGPHPKPFNKSRRGAARREERVFKREQQHGNVD